MGCTIVATENENQNSLTTSRIKGQCQPGGFQWTTRINTHVFCSHTYFTTRILNISSNLKIMLYLFLELYIFSTFSLTFPDFRWLSYKMDIIQSFPGSLAIMHRLWTYALDINVSNNNRSWIQS